MCSSSYCRHKHSQNKTKPCNTIFFSLKKKYSCSYFHQFLIFRLNLWMTIVLWLYKFWSLIFWFLTEKSLKHVKSGKCIHPKLGRPTDNGEWILWGQCGPERISIWFLKPGQLYQIQMNLLGPVQTQELFSHVQWLGVQMHWTYVLHLTEHCWLSHLR